jgi:general secretion pathway protein I
MLRHKGFSLLEILVAFSIMAIALTVLLRIFGTGVNNAVISEEYTIAVQIAESLMARTGVETALTAGETQGTEGDKYDWQITVRPSAPALSRPSLRGMNSDQQKPAPELMSVRVIVAWGEEKQPRSVELHTLKLQQQGPG